MLLLRRRLSPLPASPALPVAPRRRLHPKMSDLPLHALGLRKTKTGRDDKEPAYAISERRCCSYVGCCALLVVACGALALLLLESASARDALAPAWAAALRARRAAEHVGHFRATRLGQELERHLEHDIAEREWALLARSRMNRLEQTWRSDVAALAEQRGREADDACADGAVAALRADVLDRSDAMWSELRQTLALLDALVSRGESAGERHDSVQRDIMEELRRDGEERDAFGGSAAAADASYAALDDAARKELLDADAWRRDLVRRFLENYDRFAEENAGFALAEPSPLLEALEALYAALEGATDGGDDAPAMTWRKAEDELAALAPRLAAAGAPAYEANAPTADDALDYVQIHNVLAYIAELKWRAKLNAARPALDAARRAYDGRKLTPMAFVERLEEMEGRGAFPSDWLYSSGIDDLAFSD